MPKQKKTRQHSVLAPKKDIIQFGGATKSSPESITTNVSLEINDHSQFLTDPKLKDAAYYLAKIPGTRYDKIDAKIRPHTCLQLMQAPLI